MIFEIENLGPINKAKIDLGKKLTVLCGENGTGKTYLSYLIFALARLKIINKNKVLDAEQLNKLLLGEQIELNLDFETLLEYREARISIVKSDLNEVFGISDEKANKIFRNLKITDTEDGQNFKERILNMKYESTVLFSNYAIYLNKMPDSATVCVKLASPYKEDDDDSKLLIQRQIISFIYNQLILFPLTNSYFFPVERSAVNIFAKEIYLRRGILIDQLRGGKNEDLVKVLYEQTNRYPLAVSEAVRDANNLNNLSLQRGYYADMADEIEADLLHGKLELNKEGDFQFVSNYAKSKIIPVSVASSMVKTLASLIFYIRHVAQKYDLIIIDEPELNLHPDAQVLFVRLMAKMIRNDLRFLISTHSDYIIREINHLILLSNKSPLMKQVGDELGYDSEMFISPDDVGAYIMNPSAKSKKVTAKLINIGNDGFSIETFDKAINRLNASSEKLFEAFSESKETK